MSGALRFGWTIVLCGATHAYAQLPSSPDCRPFEVVAAGRPASDSVRIGNRLVPRTQTSVQDAWRTVGISADPKKGFGFFPGERVLIYRDSQPRGSAIYDGCTLIPEQWPVPTYWRPDSISDIELLPSTTAARVLHDRRGYQHFNVMVKRRRSKSGAPAAKRTPKLSKGSLNGKTPVR